MEVLTLKFDGNQTIPNNPALPVLVFKNALNPQENNLADQFESRFRKNGWGGCWRWGVYEFHHYHSNAHETLGVASGNAELVLGGPGGEKVSVEAGDLLVLPAGTGHKKESSSADFLVVGAYPNGQEAYDTIREGEILTDAIRDRITSTPLPDTDPLFGDSGPLMDHWG